MKGKVRKKLLYRNSEREQSLLNEGGASWCFQRGGSFAKHAVPLKRNNNYIVVTTLQSTNK